MTERLQLRVISKIRVTQDVCRIELADPQGRALPAFSAGAHVDLHLPGGVVRQYSLCNSEAESHRYVLGVLRTPDSRGGSQLVHDAVDEGQIVEVGRPRNQFGLVRDAGHSILIAGGIGITPLMSMADALWRRGGSFVLHHAVRNRERAAFRDTWAALPYAGQVVLHPDDEPGARLGLRAAIGSPVANQHLYVCGPNGMLSAAVAAAAALGWHDDAVHFERFAAEPSAGHAGDADVAFDVTIVSTGQSIHVAAGQTVVEALEAAAFDIRTVCREGICGTCLTGVLRGIPDHRDSFLTDSQRAANDQFLPCCSRSRTPHLVLDL